MDQGLRPKISYSHFSLHTHIEHTHPPPYPLNSLLTILHSIRFHRDIRMTAWKSDDSVPHECREVIGTGTIVLDCSLLGSSHEAIVRISNRSGMIGRATFDLRFEEVKQEKGKRKGLTFSLRKGRSRFPRQTFREILSLRPAR